VRHATVRLGLRLLGAIALTGIVTAASVRTSVDYLERQVDSIERTPLPPDALSPVPQDPSEPVMYLLVGSDSRAELEPGQIEEFGDPTVELGQRADAILLVRVDPGAKTGFILSIPRDTWVSLQPSGEMGRINAAYDSDTGMADLLATIEATFGIVPNHTVEIDFDDVRRVVDEVGGVSLYFDVPMRDEISGLRIPEEGFEPGPRLLGGDEALAFVRSRHTEYFRDGRWRDETGAPDLHRAERQQYFLRELARTVVNHGLDDPNEVNGMLDLAHEGGVRLSEDVDLQEVVRLMRVMRGVDPADQDRIETATIVMDPNSYYPYGPNGPQVLRWLPDDPDNVAFLAALRGERTSADDIDPGAVRLALTDLAGDGSAEAAAFALTASGFVQPRTITAESLDDLADAPPALPPPPPETETVIRYAPHRLYEAERVQAVLGDDVAMVRDDRLRTEFPGVQVLVIVRAVGDPPDLAGADDAAG
jgi:LCP family protein required for cell wall assembly